MKETGIDQQPIAKVVKEMMKEAGIEGFFTNHSLKRRLFRGGVDRKLVKEATGHRSDAVDLYQITNDNQCDEMSKIIARLSTPTVSINPESNANSNEGETKCETSENYSNKVANRNYK